METRITALPADLIFMCTAVSSSEIEIETHQETVVDVVFAGKRCGPGVSDARVFLCPREAGAWTHDRVPPISDGPAIEIPRVAASTRIRLSRHAIYFVSADSDPTGGGIVVGFHKSAIPLWPDRSEREACGLV